MELSPEQHVFFAGIGGISMSGLAQALIERGYTVSGSDVADSDTVRALRDGGVAVHIGHRAENIAGAHVVVRTTAVPESSPEIVAAREADLPVHHRSELLAWMCRGRKGIAITGTHGKSTTTAMAATIFLDLGLDPTVFVGAASPLLGGNFHIGKGEHIIFEACESDSSFLNYEGCSEVVTSCEADHLDQHKTFKHLTEAFGQFAAVADPAGFVVYNADCPAATSIAQRSPARTISYGLGGGAQLTPEDVQLAATGTDFVLQCAGERIGPVHLQVIGVHNVLNALAALAVAWGSGLDLCRASRALASYQTIGRRFQEIGQGGGVRVVDDYAHHPTEVAATLAGARATHQGRIIAIFQPHLRSRTRDLLAEFGQAFHDADVVVITDIYQPRDDGLADFDVAELLDEVRRQEPGKMIGLVHDMHEVPAYLADKLQSGDLVMTIGAGDINTIAPALVPDEK